MNFYTHSTYRLYQIKNKAFKLEKEFQSLVEENQELVSIRDWLFPILMNGQVIVSSADAKETEVGNYQEKGDVRVVAEEREKYSQES